MSKNVLIIGQCCPQKDCTRIEQIMKIIKLWYMCNNYCASSINLQNSDPFVKNSGGGLFATQ